MERKRDWSALYCDPLVQIFTLLPLVDRLRVKAVHSSWNQAAKTLETEVHNKINSVQPEAPWLMVRRSNTSIHINNNPYRFFNLEEEKTYTLNISELGDIYCAGSDNGWLLLLDETLNPYLFNPFTRSRVELPPVVGTLIETRRNLTGEENEYRFIPDLLLEEYRSAREIRATIFSRPILWMGENNGDYLVVVMYQEGFIVFCRKGDKKWTKLDDDYYFSTHMAYKNNMLYIAPNTNTGIDVWDIDSPVPSRTKVIKIQRPYPTVLPTTPNSFVYDGARLVKSDDDLLMVLTYHYLSYGNKWDFSNSFFVVYKLDDSRKEWEQVYSLGDRVLFLQCDSSISLVARDVDGANANSIYFDNNGTDDNVGDYVGVFDMETGVVTLICQREFGTSFNQHFWIVPDLTVN